MKKLLFIFIVFYNLSLYGQNNDNVIVHPPPGQEDISNKPEQDKIYSKVDKKITFNAKNLSDSFDYSIIDPTTSPLKILLLSLSFQKFIRRYQI